MTRSFSRFALAALLLAGGLFARHVQAAACDVPVSSPELNKLKVSMTAGSSSKFHDSKFDLEVLCTTPVPVELPLMRPDKSMSKVLVYAVITTARTKVFGSEAAPVYEHNLSGSASLMAYNLGTNVLGITGQGGYGSANGPNTFWFYPGKHEGDTVSGLSIDSYRVMFTLKKSYDDMKNSPKNSERKRAWGGARSVIISTVNGVEKEYEIWLFSPQATAEIGIPTSLDNDDYRAAVKQWDNIILDPLRALRELVKELSVNR